MRIVLGMALALTGCAVSEQSPADVQRKLSEPTKGRLYERNPLEQY